MVLCDTLHTAIRPKPTSNSTSQHRHVLLKICFGGLRPSTRLSYRVAKGDREARDNRSFRRGHGIVLFLLRHVPPAARGTGFQAPERAAR